MPPKKRLTNIPKPQKKRTGNYDEKMLIEMKYLEDRKKSLRIKMNEISSQLNELVDALKDCIAEEIDFKIGEMELNKYEIQNSIRSSLNKVYDKKVKALMYHKEAQINTVYNEYLANIQALDNWFKDAKDLKKDKLEKSIQIKLKNVQRHQRKRLTLKESKFCHVNSQNISRKTVFDTY